MTPEALRQTLSQDTPPADLTPAQKGLWLAAKDRWEEAHETVQADKGAGAAWVHAHLHRIEGDLANAGYWYRRAGKPECTAPLDDEWAEIAAAL